MISEMKDQMAGLIDTWTVELENVKWNSKMNRYTSIESDLAMTENIVWTMFPET